MKGNKKSLVIILALLAIALVVGAVFMIWKPEPKGITVAVSNLPDSLNPILTQNMTGVDANELLYDGLVNFEVDPQSKKIYSELALAESIEQDAKTKKTYTVVLRKALWHDGSPVIADDVAYSFSVYTEEKNASPEREYLNSFIERVSAIDEKTVEVEFRKPLPPFRAYPVLTFKIIPSRYKGQKLNVDMRQSENDRLFATEPVGSGPYKIGGWEIGKWVSFTVNQDYFGKVPTIEKVIIKKVIDPVIRMNELRQNRVNLILETSPMDRPKVEKMGNIDINSFLPYAFYQISINTKVIKDPAARQAMAMAMERRSLVPGITDRAEGVVFNSGPFPSDLFTSNIPEYVNTPVPELLREDAAKARALAEKSGLSGQKFILLFPDSLGDFGAKIAETAVTQFAKIGVTVEAKRTGDQVFKRLVFAEKNYDLALVYSEGFDNLYSTLGQWFGSSGEFNISGTNDKELNDLFNLWEKTVITKDWVECTLQINERLSELSPAIFLFKLQKDVYSRGVKNLTIATDNPFLSVESWTR